MAGQWLKPELEWSWNPNTAILSPPTLTLKARYPRVEMRHVIPWFALVWCPTVGVLEENKYTRVCICVRVCVCACIYLLQSSFQTCQKHLYFYLLDSIDFSSIPYLLCFVLLLFLFFLPCSLYCFLLHHWNFPHYRTNTGLSYLILSILSYVQSDSHVMTHDLPLLSMAASDMCSMTEISSYTEEQLLCRLVCPANVNISPSVHVLQLPPPPPPTPTMWRAH